MDPTVGAEQSRRGRATARRRILQSAHWAGVIAWGIGCIGVSALQAQSLQSAYEYGYGFWQRQQYDSAIVWLERWVTALPRDTSAWVLLARCRLRTGDTARALEALSRAIQAGLSDTALARTYPEFSAPLRSRQGRLLQQQLLSAVAERGPVAVEFAPQERFGRYYILYPPGYSAERRYHLIVLLHGNSQAPEMLFRWARQWQPQDAIIVAPEAPYVRLRPTLNAAALRFSALGEELQAPDSLREDIIISSARWYHSVAEHARRTFPLKRALPVVVGFSQGGFMAGVLLAQYPYAYAGAALVSASYYPEGKVIERLHLLRRYGVELLLLHGRQDPIVPPQTAELFANALQNAGVTHELFLFDGEHWASPEATQRLRQWLVRLLQRQ
jgi:predicted esterase